MKKIIIFLTLLVIIGCAQESVQDLSNHNSTNNEGQAQANNPNSNVNDTKALEKVNEVEKQPDTKEDTPIVPEETQKIEKDTKKTKPESNTEEESKILKPAETKDYIDVSLIAGNINRGVIDPTTLNIKVGQKVRWTNKNARNHLISCKYDFKRVFTGITIAPGEYSEFVFKEPGEYTCIDALYGARSTVFVK